jgi:7-cyano-7-deazaguanine reductase
MTDLNEAAENVRNSSQQTIDEIASAHLGKAGDGSVVKPYVTPDEVDETLLVPIPRYLNRTQYDLSGDEFYGFDTWHAYEVSFLTDNGYPINCVAKIVYDCSSECIVESKSLKLYMNSYNMATMGKTVDAAIKNARDQISAHLTAALDTEVDVYLHAATNDCPRTALPVEKYNFNLLDDEIDKPVEEISFDAYNESETILQTSEDSDWTDEMYVWTPSLRSNCRVTNQPDWGDVYIYMKGDNLPTYESLLQYIVSMRKENHFHEEICECVYKRLLDKFKPGELFVCCLYTRRGGIDINPARYSHPHLGNLANGLRNSMAFSEKTLRQ